MLTFILRNRCGLKLIQVDRVGIQFEKDMALDVDVMDVEMEMK